MLLDGDGNVITNTPSLFCFLSQWFFFFSQILIHHGLYKFDIWLENEPQILDDFSWNYTIKWQEIEQVVVFSISTDKPELHFWWICNNFCNRICKNHIHQKNQFSRQHLLNFSWSFSTSYKSQISIISSICTFHYETTFCVFI